MTTSSLRTECCAVRDDVIEHQSGGDGVAMGMGHRIGEWIQGKALSAKRKYHFDLYKIMAIENGKWIFRKYRINFNSNSIRFVPNILGIPSFWVFPSFRLLAFDLSRRSSGETTQQIHNLWTI